MPPPRKRWSDLTLPLLVALVVVAEIAFLGRLDFAAVENWTTSLYFPSYSDQSSTIGGDPKTGFLDEINEAGEVDLDEGGSSGGNYDVADDGSCDQWLEQKDSVGYERDFKTKPVRVSGGEQDWKSCSVGCKFGYSSENVMDATFGYPENSETLTILRSMESSHYYAENNVDIARRRGYKIVMTTSLSSDVPVGYFSWAEYDIMAPVGPKTADALAAAFISNCGARNFRLQALEMLEKLQVKIDSYGSCHRNKDGNVNKVETLKRYKFSLAFENSNEEDYVTEKFFQSLVAGTIPVVVGAPNIQDFAPAPGSILHIKELSDATSVANTMKYLASNPEAFNKSISWKYDGPSNSFKALIDMAAVHSSCRLCIHIATKIQEKEEKSTKFQNRPCKCTSSKGTVYHLYVRERGRFEFVSVYLRSWDFSLKALESNILSKFQSMNYVPIWKNERPKSLIGGDELNIYKIYPVGLTQRQALYSFKFASDQDLNKHIESNPCTKLEVIFV